MKHISSKIGIIILVIYVFKIAILLFFINNMYELSKEQTKRELVSDLHSAVVIIDNKSEEEILELLNDINESRRLYYDSSEYVVGQLDDDDNINFLIKGHKKFVVPFGETTAGPMQRALQHESGFIESFDYDNTPVVAAYTYIDKLDWGLVFKIDSHEVAKPFLRISIFMILTYVATTIIGAFAWIKRTQYFSASINEKNKLLVEKNVELEKFSYIASHDLKAPLRAISNLSQWIESEITNPSEDMKTYLNLLRVRVSRMSLLIDGILEYSRIGRVENESELVDLNVVMNDVELLIGNEHLCTIQYPDDLPSLYVNKTRITQVFSNLIGNAIKYHNKNNGNVWVKFEERNNAIRFSVKDDGPGIKPEYQTKIFEIFQTLQPRDQVESAGMGLTLTKKIIEQYDGKIWIESDGVSGSEFIFELPEHMMDGCHNRKESSE